MLSYASVYVEADRLVISNLPDPVYKILGYLITRADPYGKCWPSIRTIAEDTKKAKKTVENALSYLARTGCITYIRKGQRDPLTGQILSNCYQISPFLYKVRPELQAQVEASWAEHGGKPLSYSEGDITNSRTREIQPEVDKYQNQQQQDPSESERSLSSDTDDKWEREEEKRQSKARDAAWRSPTPTTPSKLKQQRSKNPEFRRGNSNMNRTDIGSERATYPTIERVAEELPNQIDEWLADRCRHDTGMSIRFARGLIKHFTAPKVEAALNDHSLRGTSIKNKAGYVFYLLVNSFVELPNEASGAGRPDDPDGSRYVTGKFADFIEH